MTDMATGHGQAQATERHRLDTSHFKAGFRARVWSDLDLVATHEGVAR